MHDEANEVSISLWESNGTLYIDKLGDDILKKIKVFDMQGNLVYVGNKMQINLTKGVYIVNIETNNRKIFRKYIL